MIVELTDGLEVRDPEDQWVTKDLMDGLEQRGHLDNPGRLEWMANLASRVCPT